MKCRSGSDSFQRRLPHDVRHSQTSAYNTRATVKNPPSKNFYSYAPNIILVLQLNTSLAKAMTIIADIAVELWQDIFLLAISEADYGNRVDICNPPVKDEKGGFYPRTATSHGMDDCRRTLTAITQVSQQWRTVSTSYPTLWQTVLLTPASTPASISLWLDRSRSRDLNIVINATNRIIHLAHIELHNVENLRHIKTVNTADILFNINTLLSPHIGRWRTLTIIGDDGITTSSIIEALHQSEQAPRLHYVHGTSLPPSVTVLTHNLRSICLRSTGSDTMTWAHFMAIIGQSMSLEHLSLWNIVCTDTTDNNDTRIPTHPHLSLSHLSSLSMGDVNAPFANRTIRYLKPYNLRCLRLSLAPIACDDVITSLITQQEGRTIARGITHLDFREVHMSITTARALCSELNDIRSCTIQESPAFAEALAGILAPEDSQSLPCMETLTFVALLGHAHRTYEYTLHRPPLNKHVKVITKG